VSAGGDPAGRPLQVDVVTTGGTIAKTYDEQDGAMRNARPVVEILVRALRLPDLDLRFRRLLDKDSLELTDADRRRIVEEVARAAAEADAVIVVHGTDTLAETGHAIERALSPTVPVVLTGAMKPWELKGSDATQNVTESLLACRVLAPGVYVAMHNRILRFPGVRKDRESLTFARTGARRR